MSKAPDTRFCVLIFGSNAMGAWATVGETSVEAWVGTYTSARGQPVKIKGTGSFALFATRAEADRIGLACRWSGQSYAVRPARGEVRRNGILVSVPEDAEIHSCQEQYGR